MDGMLVVSFLTALVCLCLSVMASKGVPVSISATYYALGNRGWLFQLLLAVTSLTLLPVWIVSSLPSHEYLSFLACASLVFVAAAPCFKMELEGKVHYAAATVCCVCAVWWQIAEGLWDVTLWFAFLGGMLSLQWKDKWCWLLEVAVVGSVYCNLYRLI